MRLSLFGQELSPVNSVGARNKHTHGLERERQKEKEIGLHRKARKETKGEDKIRGIRRKRKLPTNVAEHEEGRELENIAWSADQGKKSTIGRVTAVSVSLSPSFPHP